MARGSVSCTAGTRGQVVLCAILGRKCHKKMEHSHTQWVLKCPVYSPTSPRRRLGEISLIYRRRRGHENWKAEQQRQRAGRRITCRNGPSATSAHSANVWHSGSLTGLAGNSMGVSSHPYHSPAVARPVPDAGRRLSALALQPAMASLQRPNPNPVGFYLGMSIRTLFTCHVHTNQRAGHQFPAMLVTSEIGAAGEQHREG